MERSRKWCTQSGSGCFHTRLILEAPKMIMQKVRAWICPPHCLDRLVVHLFKQRHENSLDQILLLISRECCSIHGILLNMLFPLPKPIFHFPVSSATFKICFCMASLDCYSNNFPKRSHVTLAQQKTKTDRQDKGCTKTSGGKKERRCSKQKLFIKQILITNSKY